LETLTDWTNEHPDRLLHQIYADNLPWMESYLIQNSGTQSDAHDLFQESITAAWINLKTGRFTGTREQFNAYIRQIARHKWINELRSRSRKKTISTEIIPERGDDLPSGDDAENAEKLQASFRELGEKCRQILGLYYYQKKSMAEIAVQMENTENSIKTIKYRCMMQLRQLFLEKSRQNGGK
jgi:RNA polymerase sigma factor (sigma-70 family)